MSKKPPQPQPQPQLQQQPYTSHGLMGSLENIGKDFARAVNTLANDANTIYSKSVHGDITTNFVSGAIIVLVSRMSAKCLQILQSSDGNLLLDANGVDSQQSFNNKWVVRRTAAGHYQFSNFGNWLAIQNGNLVLISGVSESQQLPAEGNFRLHQTEQFVMLESCAEPGHFVAAGADGSVRPPVVSSADRFSHFGVLFCSRIA